jgi:hypothetical protein
MERKRRMLYGPGDGIAIKNVLKDSLANLRQIVESGDKEADAKILEAEQAIRAALGRL